jgi:hypothetical protein
LGEFAATQLYRSYAAQAQAYADAIDPTAVVDDLLGGRAIKEKNYSILMGTLPYKTIAVGARLSELPASLRHRVKLALYLSELDRSLDSPATTQLN